MKLRFRPGGLRPPPGPPAGGAWKPFSGRGVPPEKIMATSLIGKGDNSKLIMNKNLLEKAKSLACSSLPSSFSTKNGIDCIRIQMHVEFMFVNLKEKLHEIPTDLYMKVFKAFRCLLAPKGANNFIFSSGDNFQSKMKLTKIFATF